MSRIILGIDPGLKRTGYAIIEYNNKDPQLKEAGVLTTNDIDPLPVRLKTLYDSLHEVIEEFKPDTMVVENLYSHYSHPLTSVIMGHARGVILMCAAEKNISLVTYAATRIKKAITGNGRASKMQMQRSIKSIMKMETLPEPADVADAIAAGLCHIEAAR